MPSFGGEVKPSVPCRRFATCKRSWHLPWKSHAVGKIGSAISRPYFLPSLIEVFHVTGWGVPLEMTGKTKSGAQRARSYGLGASRCRASDLPPTLLYSTPIGRQAWESISRPCLGAKARFLSFSMTQLRAVTGLLTGLNTLRRHLHLMWLSDSQLCRSCGAEDETSAHTLCECEALASHRHVYLGSFLDPQDNKSICLGAIWNFSKVTGLPWIDMGHTGPVS
jgi:hypothetical protein